MGFDSLDSFCKQSNVLKLCEMREVWREIKGFPDYEISSFGNVRSCKSGKLLKPWKSPSNDGNYIKYVIGLCRNGKRYMRSIARLVLLHFNPVKNMKYLHADHINFDTSDNRLINLQWLSPQDNTRHNRAKGVSFHILRQKWCTYIQIDGKKKHLGYFDTEEEAQQVRDEAVKKHYIITPIE